MTARSHAEAADLRRSYGFLVDRLLPVHLLPPSRRDHLAAALATGEPERLHRETLAALVHLEGLGAFEEVPAPRAGARLFRHRGTGDRVLLEEPRRVAQQASRPTSADVQATLADESPEPQARLALRATSRPGSQVIEDQMDVLDQRLSEPDLEGGPERVPGPSLGGTRISGAGTAGSVQAAATLERTPPEAAPPVIPAPEPSVTRSAGAGTMEGWGTVEPLLELAAIESQLEPFGDRLRRIVAQLETSLPGAKVRLLCLDAEGAESLGDGGVEVLDRAAADEVPHYREALRLGETQFATSAPVGAEPASGRIAAAVPLYVGGEPWGLLRITWDQGSFGSVPELVRLLAPLARLVAVAIQNQSMLEKLVFVDPLTTVYNRAFYERQVTLEIERANRTNQKFALLVMDVDDFKPINDKWGHRAGDQVLSQLAREVRVRMRKIDLMFRYGGEEFVLLLPGADLEEGQRTAERLRGVVADQRFLPEGVPSPLRVTVSIGGAVYPDQSRTKTGIFSAADTALYRAKHDGKNRVAF